MCIFIFIIFIFLLNPRRLFFFSFGFLWCTCYDLAESSLASLELWEELCTFEIFISFWLTAKMWAAVVRPCVGLPSPRLMTARTSPALTKAKSICRTESYSLWGGWCKNRVSPGQSGSQQGQYQKCPHTFFKWGVVGKVGGFNVTFRNT